MSEQMPLDVMVGRCRAAKEEGARDEHACVVAFLCDLKADHRKAGRTVEMQAIADAVNAIAAGSHRG